MPAELDSCVAHVLARPDFEPQAGRTPEESAYAICRVSLGLKEDGSEDDKGPKLPEEEMQVRAGNEIARRKFNYGPILRKRMVVAKPIGEFVNGDQEGVMDEKFLSALVRNFKKYPRQVPIFALGDHVEDLDERPPDGWVEGVSITADGDLEVDAKLHGAAVQYVLEDLVRGASIGTTNGKTYDGAPIGPVLHHVLLTNSPYIKGLNIAAAQIKGSETVAYCFTALPEETMPEKDKKTDPPEKEKERVKTEDAPGVTEFKAKEEEVLRLKAENLALKESVEDLKSQLANSTIDKDKEELALRVKKLEFERDAQKVRELVETGLRTGTLKAAWCSGYRDGGDSGTLTWFKASRFEGDIRLLKWAVENNPPLYKIGQTFHSGSSPETGGLTLSQEDKEKIRSLGLDPDRLAGITDGTTFEEWRKLKAEGGKK